MIITYFNSKLVQCWLSPLAGDEGIIIRPTTAGRPQVSGEEVAAPGSTAPRSSPTQSSMQEQIKFQQNEALKRLQVGRGHMHSLTLDRRID